MKIFLLERIRRAYVDEISGRVIVAPDEQTAREIANKVTMDEGEIWDSQELVSCTEIDLSTAGEILTDSRSV